MRAAIIKTALTGGLAALMVYGLRIITHYPRPFSAQKAAMAAAIGMAIALALLAALALAAKRLPAQWRARCQGALARRTDGLLRGFLLAACLALLVLPVTVAALEDWFDVQYAENDLKVLYGVYNQSKMPPLTAESLMDGAFQTQSAEYFNNNFSLRPVLIKLNNQLYYDLFDKSYMYDNVIVKGKQAQLFEEAYILFRCNITKQAHEQEVEDYVLQLCVLQDLLKRRGITFLLLISPSKATTYPEYIPDQFWRFGRPGKLNQQILMPLLAKHGVNHYDAQAAMLQWRDKAPAPLFCQGGTHWNDLGGIYAMQGMLAKLEALSGKKLTRLRLDGVDLNPHPVGFDRDLAELLNLYFPPYNFASPQPKVTPLRDADTFVGKMALVGGSFNWTILDLLHKYGVFQTMDFFYYYHTFFRRYEAGKTPPEKTVIDVWTMNWDERIFDKDFVIVEMNSAVIPYGNYVSAFVGGAVNGDKVSKTTAKPAPTP